MTAWKEVDAARQVRNAAVIANAITKEPRLAVKGTTPFGHVPRATAAVQAVTVLILNIGSVVRKARV